MLRNIIRLESSLSAWMMEGVVLGCVDWGGGVSVFRLAKSASRNKLEGGIIKKAARHI